MAADTNLLDVGDGDDIKAVVAFAVKVYGDADKSAADKHASLKTERFVRRAVAYTLKIIAVMGGLAIAADAQRLAPWVPQALGITVAVAVALDSIFSNHARLLGVLRACNAYRALRERIAHELNRDFRPMLAFKSTNRPRFAIDYPALLTRCQDELFSGEQAIKLALEELDLKALTNLAVENKQRDPGITTLQQRVVPHPPAA